MSKTKLIMLFVLISLALASNANARTASFTMALGIVKIFDSETKELLPEEINAAQREAFLKINKKNKKEAYSRITSLRRSEVPGRKRFKRIVKIIEKHTKKHLKEVDRLASKLKGADRAKVEDMSVKLRALRDDLLIELKATAYSERKAIRGIKANPVLDRSPYEERPGDTRGLYDR